MTLSKLTPLIVSYGIVDRVLPIGVVKRIARTALPARRYRRPFDGSKNNRTSIV
jgi:hypothetical protein